MIKANESEAEVGSSLNKRLLFTSIITILKGIVSKEKWVFVRGS